MEVGQRLKQRRLGLKLTQEEVAEKMGITRQTMSNWENGKSYPDIERVIRLAELYQLSLDELLKGDTKLIHHLKENTTVNRWLKMFVGLLLFNMGLLILLATLPKLNILLFYTLFGLMGVNSLLLFYLVIKKI